MSDPYPNDGTFFQPVIPEETVKANEEEKKLTAQVLPALNDALVWFDEEIAHCDSIEFAYRLKKDRQEPIENVLLALNITKEILSQKKEEYSNLKLNLPS